MTTTHKAWVKRVLYMLAGILIFWLFMRYAFRFLLPFLIAGAWAALIRKPVLALARRTSLHEKAWSMILTAFSVAAVSVGLYFGIRALLCKADMFVAQLPEFYCRHIMPAFLCILKKVSAFSEKNAVLGSFIGAFLEKGRQHLFDLLYEISLRLANMAGKWALRVPDVFLFLSVTMAAVFLIHPDYERIMRAVRSKCPDRVLRIFCCIRTLFTEYFLKMLRAYACIFSVTFFELVAGLLLLRVSHAVSIALLIAAADILPLIGTGTVLLPWAFFSFTAGKTSFAFGLVLLYLIITLVRNWIEPKLVGKKLGIPPIVSLFLFYAGLRLGGVVWAVFSPVVAVVFKGIAESGLLSRGCGERKLMRKK